MFARTGIDARKFVGAVVTHEHGDHAAHIGKYADRAIDVYASQGTLAACRIDKVHRSGILSNTRNAEKCYLLPTRILSGTTSNPCD